MKGASASLDVEKIAAELEQMALSKFSTSQAKALVIAKLKEKFKDQPHELKQIEPVVNEAATKCNLKKMMEGKK